MCSKIAFESLVSILQFSGVSELTQASAHVNKVWNYAAKLRRTWKYATVRVSAQPHSVYVKAIQQVQLDEKAASNGWSGSHIVSISLVRCANLYEFVQADVFHFLQEVCLKFGYYVVSQWAQLVKDLPPTLKRVTL